MRQVFSFPRTVNEKAARVVAGCVALIGLVALATPARWLLVPLALGFWARVLTGPTLSPLGQLATRVVAPRLGPPRVVAGPPKRFAQALGAAMTTAGAVAWVGFGLDAAADALLLAVVAAATLESVLAFCIGCRVFALLMRAGLVPETVCVDCADIAARSASA